MARTSSSSKDRATHQRGHALWAVAGDGSGKQFVGQQQCFHVGGKLGKKPLGLGTARIVKKTARNFNPLRMASSRMRMPSMAQ